LNTPQLPPPHSEKAGYTEADYHKYLGKEKEKPSLTDKFKRAAKEKIKTGMKMTQKIENGDSKGKDAELPAEASDPSSIVSTGKGVEGKQEDRQATGDRSGSEPVAARGLGLSTASDLKATSSSELTDSERTMYASERLDNFRWLSKVAGRYADGPPLTEKDLVEEEVAKEVGEIGESSRILSVLQALTLYLFHRPVR
jgi:hypothetical protein